MRWTKEEYVAWLGKQKLKEKRPEIIEDSSESKLERKFLNIWAALGGPELKREVKFHPERRWRADFVAEKAEVIIEIDGGIWVQGRHNRGPGMANDAEKAFAATVECGFVVLRFVDTMVNSEYIKKAIEFVRECETLNEVRDNSAPKVQES